MPVPDESGRVQRDTLTGERNRQGLAVRRAEPSLRVTVVPQEREEFRYHGA